jgi:hypothetical protein
MPKNVSPKDNRFELAGLIDTLLVLKRAPDADGAKDNHSND